MQLSLVLLLLNLRLVTQVYHIGLFVYLCSYRDDFAPTRLFDASIHRSHLIAAQGTSCKYKFAVAICMYMQGIKGHANLIISLTCSVIRTKGTFGHCCTP